MIRMASKTMVLFAGLGLLATWRPILAGSETSPSSTAAATEATAAQQPEQPQQPENPPPTTPATPPPAAAPSPATPPPADKPGTGRVTVVGDDLGGGNGLSFTSSSGE